MSSSAESRTPEDPENDPFTRNDLAALESRGIGRNEAREQLQLLRNPPPFIELDRPCTAGDGILVLSHEQKRQALQAQEVAQRMGRILKFVPASGAASRMFKALLSIRSSHENLSEKELRNAAREKGSGSDFTEIVTFLDGISRFAFFHDIQDNLASRGQQLEALIKNGEWQSIVDALLSSEGLDYRSLPKGLLKFHQEKNGSRTAFEEHLREAAVYGQDESGTSRLHFTVSPEHRSRFESLLHELKPVLKNELGADFDVTFSSQKPATDTLATDEFKRPFRDDNGDLLFRPGGHGALLANLNDLNGDVIFVKNIDNVSPEKLRTEEMEWKKIVCGVLVQLQDQIHTALNSLRIEPSEENRRAARELARTKLGIEVPKTGPLEESNSLIRVLDRPLRICGMVRNEGEPGGGPFWVRGKDGSLSAQIVESAQVATSSDEQVEKLRSSTHFNPVDLVLAVRDPDGKKYDLARFVDPQAVFLAEKSQGGRTLTALERPGLWNGSMAHWNTVFVEVPSSTFTPVKTLNDLLRPEHSQNL